MNPGAAGRRLEEAPRLRGASGGLAAAVAAWLGVILFAASRGWLEAPLGQPPVGVLVAAGAPLLLFGGLYRGSPAFRSVIRRGEPAALTYLQAWRILGGIFLVLLSFRLIPSAFALPAGFGDVAIGLSAPFVAAAAARRPDRGGNLLLGWHALGLLDLLVAVGTGVTLASLAASAAGPGSMAPLGRLPLVLIPGFMVPLFVILHIAVALQLRAVARGAAGVRPGRRETRPRAASDAPVSAV